MKFYIAARFDKKEQVRKWYEQLKKLGHTISGDWTTHTAIRPYDENKQRARSYAEEDLNAARLCDVMIILSDEGGTGMYVELGAAISHAIEHNTPKIYVIGEHNERCMFYFHPVVKHRGTIDDVLTELKIS